MSRENSDTRTRILNAAWRLLESGDGGVSMSDIAREAGISRQALYLHFPKRADLLIAVTLHIDEVKDVEGRLAASRAAATGRARLAAFIEAWGCYIPEIHGVARALIHMQENDEAAREAWSNRLQAVRHGCSAAVAALARDGDLAEGLSVEDGTNLLWAFLTVEGWEVLTGRCGWTQERYLERMTAAAERMLIG